MNKITFKSLLIGASAIVTISAGQPALADDTEILSTTTTAARENRPNTLFIADTSGSMSASITTEEIYDPTQTYAGACDANYVYYTTDGTAPPACAGNINWFDRGDLVCQQADIALDNGGRYSDLMAQYWASSGTGAPRWDELSPQNQNWMVECARDDGVHGDGGPEVYARRGSSGDPWTNDDTEAVFWGAQPTEITYYLYTGNYLNYVANPPVSGQTRNSVMRDVLVNLYSTLQDTNAGLMRFNGGNGGRVIEAIQNLDQGTHRQDLITTAAALPASGVTPLSETLYESTLYWTGATPNYGTTGNTDADALDGAGNYEAPTSFECTNNYQILLSDGAPVSDFDTPALAPTLTNWFGLTGNSAAEACTGGTAGGSCMDDMAAYLAPPAEGDDTLIKAKADAGVPDVTTYTIGFQLGVGSTAEGRMIETADRGKGRYFPANSLVDLVQALETIQELEASGETTFTSPSVSVNSFNRTRTLNDLYFTVFEASNQLHWPGNLKRYKLDNDGTIVDAVGANAVGADGLFIESTRSFWTPAGVADGGIVREGGAASVLPAVAARTVYTNFDNGSETATLIPIESATLTANDLGIAGLPNDPTVPELVDWIRGNDLADIDEDPTTTLRKQIGDPLHSQPTSIVYGGTATNPEGLVLFGTNDGFLHAIDMETGVEQWSFLPFEYLEQQNSLFKDPAVRYKNYGVDGNMVPIIFDENQDGIIAGQDFIYLAFGMRRGGESYYLLDITDNTQPPTLKWRLDQTDLDQLGWTWSPPVPARVRAPSLGQSPASQQIVLLFGGGYDKVHDVVDHPAADDGEGGRVFMVDLDTGKALWAAGTNAVPGAVATTEVDRNGATMNRAIPGELTAIDISGDGYVDRIYAGDMGGQILRFDITNELSGATFDATGGVIAQLGAEGNGGTGAPLSETRRFYTTPDVALIRDPTSGNRFLAILIGSGYRASPLNENVSDRFYSLWDRDIFTSLTQNAYDNYNIIREGDLATVNRNSNAPVVVNSGQRGWLLPLGQGEKILSNAGTFLGTTFFASFTPRAATLNPCVAAGGLNRLYRIDPATAAPPVLDSNADPSVDQRAKDLAQTGIVADPVFLFGDKDAPQPVPLQRPPGCPAELSDKECVCLDDPSNAACGPASCEDDPSTASAVVCLANFCTSLPACLRPIRTIWTQEGVE
ncbi:MAG: hypothetical protein AAGC71_11090 [Pseudomonadota bacterium]